MFHVYAVRLKDGQKDRYYVGSEETLEAAKHSANCCTCGNADYAYVKDSKDESTVFFLRSPDYDEGPVSGKKEP